MTSGGPQVSRCYDTFDRHDTFTPFPKVPGTYFIDQGPQGHFIYDVTFIRSVLFNSSPGLPHDPSHPEDRSQTLKQLTIGWD